MKTPTNLQKNSIIFARGQGIGHQKAISKAQHLVINSSMYSEHGWGQIDPKLQDEG